MIKQGDIDTLIEKRNAAKKGFSSLADWDCYKIKGVIDLDYPQGKRKVFAGGLKGVESASLPLVQKYDMGRDSELGQMISDLNKYFKAERDRVNKDYDDILGQLSYKTNQIYVPQEFMERLLPLWHNFPDQEKNKNIKAVSFVPYEEQIPAYKFEMVGYLCLASVIYGYREYAADNEDRFLKQRERKYKLGMPVLNKTAKKMQELLYPVLQQLENPDGPQNYVKRLSKLRSGLPEWDKRVYMGEATNAEGYFANGLDSFACSTGTPYERLIIFAQWMYVWRAGWCGKPSGKYVMYPVLRLLDNALAPDVQMKADDIRDYQCISDYLNYRDTLVNKYYTKDDLQK